MSGLKETYEHYYSKSKSDIFNHECDIIKRIGDDEMNIIFEVVANAIYEFASKDKDCSANDFVLNITNRDLLRWMLNPTN